MNKNFSFGVCLLGLLLFAQLQGFAQIPVAGKYRSSTGNVFYVVDTQEGFKYQRVPQKGDTNVSKVWNFAKWQNTYDYNKYLVYNTSDNKPLEIYLTVKMENGVVTMALYNAKATQNAYNTWTKIAD